VTAVTFSPDGITYLSGAADGTIFLHSTRTGLAIRRLPMEAEPIAYLKFAPDGLSYAVVMSQSILIRNLRTARQTHELHDSRQYGLSYGGFSENGRYLVAGYFDGVFIWDLQTAQVVTIVRQGLQGYEKPVTLSRDGTLLATGYCTNEELHDSQCYAGYYFVNRLNGEPVFRSRGNIIAKSLAIAPDNNALAVVTCRGSYGGYCNVDQLVLHDLQSGATIYSREIWLTHLLDILITPDSELILLYNHNEIQVRRFADGQLLLQSLVTAGSIHRMTIAPDGKTVLMGICTTVEGSKCTHGATLTVPLHDYLPPS